MAADEGELIWPGDPVTVTGIGTSNRGKVMASEGSKVLVKLEPDGSSYWFDRCRCEPGDANYRPAGRSGLSQ